MILSIKHKFVFIHMYKTAGTTVSSCLLQQDLGVENRIVDLDVHKHINAAEICNLIGRELFASLFSFVFVRNSWDLEYSLYKYILGHPNHHRHEELKKYADFAHYLKTEYYKHLERKSQNPEPQALDRQMAYVCDESGQPIVDFVGRFETLTEDFNRVLATLGFPQLATLPHLNISTKGDFRKQYTPQLVDYVAQMRARDIAFFEYSFE